MAPLQCQTVGGHDIIASLFDSSWCKRGLLEFTKHNFLSVLRVR